jgi:Domain of unknown function (DUF4328)
VTMRSTATRGRVVQIAIAVDAAARLISDAWLSTRLRDGSFVLHIDQSGSSGAAYWTGTPVSGLSSITNLTGLAAIVVWLFWQHQATENLWGRGYTGLRIRPGWAVGWWFIPVAWWFMPCVAMLELDRRSTPDGTPRRASPVIGVWWAAWLAFQLVPLIGIVTAVWSPLTDLVQRTGGRTTSMDFTAVAHAAAPWLLVAGILAAVAGALAIAVVRRIDAAQEAMAEASSTSLVPVPARPDALG